MLYPGLPAHPGYATAARQMCGAGEALYGGMISFIHRAGPEAARQAVARTRIFTLAESLGGVSR